MRVRVADKEASQGEDSGRCSEGKAGGVGREQHPVNDRK